MPEGDATTTTTAQGGDAGGATTTTEPKTFTQEELDRVVGERLAREKAKLGDVEELRRKAEQFDRLEEERKSELERAVDTAKKEADKAARDDRDGFWRERLLRSEVKVAASGKVVNPAVAVKLLDLSAFDLDDDGNVDAEVLAKAIDDLVKDHPYLAANGTQRRTDFDAGPRTANGFDAGPRTPAPGGEDFNATLRRQLGKQPA